MLNLPLSSLLVAAWEDFVLPFFTVVSSAAVFCPGTFCSFIRNRTTGLPYLNARVQ